MRKLSLTNFEGDITNIREYIKYIQFVNEIEIYSRKSSDVSLITFSEHLHSIGTSKKLFEYKSIIMSLYGILEKYVNIWIQEHIDNLHVFYLKYEQFSNNFREEHFGLSIKLISKINEGKLSKYDHLKKEDILTNLNSCVNSVNYKLNGEAFAPFSGNLKHSKIADAFKPLDINIEVKLKKNKDFRDYLISKYGGDISNRGADLFSTIDDLVIRRNDIAHGMDIDSILNIVEFDDYMDFLERYGKAIFETISEKEIEHESLFLYEKIENIQGVYHQGSILCFEIQNHEINVGDFIIIKTSSDEFMKKEISEIQENEKSFERLVINDKTKIGVNLSNGVTQNQTFYIKKNEQ
jgi:hypothetical protein